MGKKARDRRSKVKALLRLRGYSENEFGELKKRMTKAEARSRLLFRSVLENEILEELSRKATEDIQAAEDAAFIKSIERALSPVQPVL